MARRRSTKRAKSRIFDFSLGLYSDVSDYATSPRYVRRVDNMLFRPQRAISSREGSRDITSASILTRPHSIGKYYHSSGNKLFIGTDDLAVSGNIQLVDSATTTIQTIPFTPTQKQWSFENISGVLVAQQEGSLQPPIFYNKDTGANTWLTSAYPVLGFPATATLQAVTAANPPLAAPTTNNGAIAEGAVTAILTAACNGTGADFTFTIGGVSVPHVKTTNLSTTIKFLDGTPSTATGGLTSSTTYYYRVRGRFSNGSGRASAPQSVVLGVGNNTVDLTSFPTSSRPDFLGWTLERTRAGSTSVGPFYFIADGTTQAYKDERADNTLYSVSDDEIHARPPAFEGVVANNDRLYGWTASGLWVSQAIGDAEATGIFNFDPENVIYFAKDDGDSIVTVKAQTDRLIIYKHRTVWALMGDNPDNFQLINLYEGVGACGSRAVASFGGTHFFHSGHTGLFKLSGNKIDPVGWAQVGFYKSQIDISRFSEVLMVNYLGELLLCWLPTTSNTYVDDVIVYDIRFGNWSHFKGWRAKDALVQKDDLDFGQSTLISCDPQLGNLSVDNALVNNGTYLGVGQTVGAVSRTYTQKFNSAGAKLWGVDGISIDQSAGAIATSSCAVTHSPDKNTLITAFFDNRTGGRIDLYIQKQDATGAIQWGAGGVPVTVTAGGSTATFRGLEGVILTCGDLAGGTFVCWNDDHTATATGQIIYLQYFNAAGVPQYAVNGIQPIPSAALLNQKPIEMVPDGAGGVIILWNAQGTGGGIRLVRVNAAGATIYNTTVQTEFGARATEKGIASMSVTVFPATGEKYLNIGYVKTTNSQFITTLFLASTGANSGTAGIDTGDLPTVIGQQKVVATGDGGWYVFTTTNPLTSSPIQGVWGRRFGISSPLHAGWTLFHLGADIPSASVESAFEAIADGFGGAICGFRSKGFTGTPFQAWAVKGDKNGQPAWGANGIKLSGPSGVNDCSVRCVSSNGDGGAVFLVASDDVGNTVSDVVVVSSGGAITSTTDFTTIGSYVRAGFPRSLSLGGIPQGVPIPALSSTYHLWSLFSGAKDERSVTGTGGIPIRATFQTAQLDDGMPDVDKDYERIEVFAESGSGALSVTMAFDADDADPVSLPLSRNTSAAIWNDPTLHWNDGTRWNNTGSQVRFESGVPEGTFGRRYTLDFAGEIDSGFTLNGYVVDSIVLPQRNF